MEFLKGNFTPGMREALRLMRGQPLTVRSGTDVSATHGGLALRVHTFIQYRIGRREIADSVIKRLGKLQEDYPYLFDVDDAGGLILSYTGMRLFMDQKGNGYLFESSEGVDARYKELANDAKRKSIKAQKFPTCFLNPSLDMLVYADNWIEHNLALRGFGMTGEPCLQIPTPQEPEWWLNKDKYIAMSVLLLGRPGNTVQHRTSRGELRSFIQTAAAFDGLNDRIQALAAELTELGLPVPK